MLQEEYQIKLPKLERNEAKQSKECIKVDQIL